jgi:predicted amidohydrolase
MDLSKLCIARLVVEYDYTFVGNLTDFMHLQIHLFDAPSVSLQESKTTARGNEVVVVDVGFAKIGLSICYDVRFPELYAHMSRNMGADIFLIPAAFTVPTGSAHWETLLRARAIENQCVVIAPAQYGIFIVFFYCHYFGFRYS